MNDNSTKIPMGTPGENRRRHGIVPLQLHQVSNHPPMVTDKHTHTMNHSIHTSSDLFVLNAVETDACTGTARRVCLLFLRDAAAEGTAVPMNILEDTVCMMIIYFQEYKV